MYLYPIDRYFKLIMYWLYTEGLRLAEGVGAGVGGGKQGASQG